MARNLNSRLDCTPILPVTFITPQEHKGVFVYYKVSDARQCCWTLLQLVQGDLDVEGSEERGDARIAARIHNANVEGELRILLHAAFDDVGKPVTIMALHIPGFSQHFYWTTRDANATVHDLEQQGILEVTLNATLNSSASAVSPVVHHRLYMVLQMSFEMTVRIEDSAEYRTATQLAHLDKHLPVQPENAMSIIESNKYLRSKFAQRLLWDDRYAHELEDWEIFVAELADVGAAEYLEIRRRYFDRFARSVYEYRQEHDLAADDKVPAFKDWKNKIDLIKPIRDWSWSRRRLFVEAWAALGMLDENKF